MKKVIKSPEPEDLRNYRNRYEALIKTPKQWKDLKKTRVKNIIQGQLITDQKGICAYCETYIREKFCSVEHFIFPLQEDSRFTDEMNCSRSLDMHRFRDIIGLVNDLLGLWRHKA